MFKYIDRGISDVKLFSNIISKWYPNVKSVWVNQNWTSDKDSTYTFNDMYIDLNLDTLIIIAVQNIGKHLMIMNDNPIKSTGLIAFLTNKFYYDGDDNIFEEDIIYNGNEYLTDDFKVYLDEAIKFYNIYCFPF